VAFVLDQDVLRAVSRVLQRSERQEDVNKLVGTFVDVGSLPLLENENHQVLYGRRGTGKTHVLKVLGSKLEENKNALVVYEDARTLGSTAQFSDHSVSLRQRCLSLFRDILGPVQNALMDRIVERPNAKAEQAFQAVTDLAASIVEPVRIYREETLETAEAVSLRAEASVSLKASSTPSVGVNAGDTRTEKSSIARKIKVENDDKVVFPSLHEALSKALDLTDTRLYLLIDEWASLPADLQPYLAEFLKRGVLPIQRATLKIASLEYRSRFSTQDEHGPIGFELGADVATAPDLDDYYVYDRNPDVVADAYSTILHRHLSVDLPPDYLKEKHRAGDGPELASRLFTERETFKELARAAEGVIRDLINIFTLAFFNAQRRGRDSIDRRAVLEAARQWFEQDKSQHLDDHMQRVLRKIVTEVIGRRKARSFMLPRHLEKHPIVQKLFDARVLHHVLRGYADKDNPGVRYNIYTLDYGTYVDLLGTSKQPELGFVETTGPGAEIVVPFDDKRSIRRIVLNESVLDAEGAS
jgi:hypothetical protein